MGRNSEVKCSLGDLKTLLADAQKRVNAATGPVCVPTAHVAAMHSSPSKTLDRPAFAQTFTPLKREFCLSDSDRRLFAKAMEGVRRLKTPARVLPIAPKPLPIPRQTLADESAALRQAREAIMPSPMSWDFGVDLEEDQSYLRDGANPDLLRKLRRGLWVTQCELDLHHHTQDEAHAALSAFLAVAKQRQWRCVRIIHGKGMGSHRKVPVLRGKVRRWLQLRADVIAYCEPKPNGGGSGAVLVLLDPKA